ncbi:Z-ring formation inhibitor MciZ [Tumebacillus sp. DT12]|uniref:Z-ring formation inhibitor MciZ n=1 Tax=Tumebacillus lacus TaxID=2995335 RepID=A0ABT3X039_9BACL|nr:Z-ring formation inhibitor MciZ [Tumebacillus lacus]MCX7569137.1 Z-ring formation inhibitor MciZ [Tumebacillus lacus]
MVKTYVSERSLRMVGKAWQIRAILRAYAGSDTTLHQFLSVNCHASSRRE